VKLVDMFPVVKTSLDVYVRFATQKSNVWYALSAHQSVTYYQLQSIIFPLYKSFSQNNWCAFDH